MMNYIRRNLFTFIVLLCASFILLACSVWVGDGDNGTNNFRNTIHFGESLSRLIHSMDSTQQINSAHLRSNGVDVVCHELQGGGARLERSNGEVWYVRKPETNDWAEIVAVNCGEICRCFSGHDYHANRFESKPEKILGMFISADGFILKDSETYQSWIQTHKAFYASRIENDRVMQGIIDGFEFVFSYESGAKCKIFSPNGLPLIEEEFKLDADGVVIDIHRTPENWQKIWEMNLKN